MTDPSEDPLDEELRAVEKQLRELPPPAVPDSLLSDLLSSVPHTVDDHPSPSRPVTRRTWLAPLTVMGGCAVLVLLAVLLNSPNVGESDASAVNGGAEDGPDTATITHFSDETNPCHILPPLPIEQ